MAWPTPKAATRSACWLNRSTARRRSPLTSIVSYPDRGPWGDNRYPGNSSGYLLIDLCATYAPRAVLDPMEGGGTSRDVCADMGITYQGFDLHSGVDSLHDEIGA